MRSLPDTRSKDVCYWPSSRCEINRQHSVLRSDAPLLQTGSNAPYLSEGASFISLHSRCSGRCRPKGTTGSSICSGSEGTTRSP